MTIENVQTYCKKTSKDNNYQTNRNSNERKVQQKFTNTTAKKASATIVIATILLFATSVSYPHQVSATIMLDWSDLDLSSIDWSQVDGIDGLGVDWSQVDWSEIDLSQVDQSKLELLFEGLDVDWSQVDWSEIDLSQVDYSQVNWDRIDWNKVIELTKENNIQETTFLEVFPLVDYAYAVACGGLCLALIAAAATIVVAAIGAAATLGAPAVAHYYENHCPICAAKAESTPQPANPGDSGGGGPESPIGTIALASSLLVVFAAFAVWIRQQQRSQSPLMEIKR